MAPSIDALNVNQDFAQPVSTSVNPTVPVSVLNQVAPQQYPMPTSLASAFQTLGNGSMFTDMSKTSELTSILGSLAELANNTAQLSGNLAGDAAANALNSAVALGQQVAAMVGAAMNTNVADPPQTLTSQGAALEVLDEIDTNSNGGSISPTDQAAAGAVGAPIPAGSDVANGDAMEESFRKYIYAGADLTAERRAFSPSVHDIAGVTSISVLVPDLPSGGSVRWSVPPLAGGRYLLRDGRTVQMGNRADITALIPGKTTIDVEARDSAGHVLESLKLELCIPQFVQIVRDPALDALLGTYGLVTEEMDEVIRVAKSAVDTIPRSGNVRIVWPVAPINDTLPAQFSAGGAAARNLSTVTLLGNPPRPAVAGATPGGAGPTTYNDAISIWVGACDDNAIAAAADIDDVTRDVVTTMLAESMTSSPEKTLAIEVLGRLLGSTIAHEIVHSLIGATLTGGKHNSPAVPGDLMNEGAATSFQEKTGFDLIGQPGTGPLRSILIDRGMQQMVAPGAESQTQLDLNFPVPPVFK